MTKNALKKTENHGKIAKTQKFDFQNCGIRNKIAKKKYGLMSVRVEEPEYFIFLMILISVDLIWDVSVFLGLRKIWNACVHGGESCY